MFPHAASVRDAAARGCLLLALAVAPSAFAGNDPLSAVWLSDHKTVKRLDPATNQVVVAVGLARKPDALATNPADGSVWVLSEKRLQHFDASAGHFLREIDLRALATRFDEPKQLALNPYNGSLWLGGERTLLHVSKEGSKLLEWQVPGELEALAIDPDESLWLLTHHELLHVSPAGRLLDQLDLRRHAEEPDSLAIDGLGSLLWIAGKKTLFQFNLANLSEPPKVVSLPAASRDSRGRREDHDHYHDDHRERIRVLGVHPLLGTLWVVTEDRLHLYDRQGAFLKSVDLAAFGLDHANSLVFEPASLSLWLAAKRAIARFSGSGEFVALLPLAKEVSNLAAAPFALKPTLGLLEPADGSLTNNPYPRFRVELGSACNSTPCVLPPAYYDALRLQAELNAEPIGSLFARATGAATYTPLARLPEGANSFIAEAFDLFGHASNKVEARFTVDTVPPRFLAITPADGSNVTNASVAISGSVDDPTATVMLLDGSGTALSLNTANFNFAVTLKAGLNNFVLLARDAAGNDSSVPLRLNYNAISVKIESPTLGAFLAARGAIVSGSFRGPANTGITVNGTIAHVAGNRFYANLILESGANSLTATATTPEGITVTDTVSVTVNGTGADSIEVVAEPASGIAPLTVRFAVRSNSALRVVRVAADFDGDGSSDFTTPNPDASIEHTYPTPGVYHATVTTTDAQNGIANQTVVIVVQDAQQMDQLLTGLWGGMNDALKRGDLSAAIQYLNESAKRKYKPVFQALLPHMPEIIASYSAPIRASISESIAEYAVERPYGNGRRVYLVYFLKGADGVWRLDAM
jgi:hypothetical protein